MKSMVDLLDLQYREMLKTSLTLFFIVSVIFSTIYTPQAILPTLQEQFHLSMAQTNLLLSGMLFVLMIATPFYASFIRRFEKKKIMMVALFFLSLALLLSTFARSYEMLLFSRLIQGVFLPAITATMLSYVQEIYPKEHRGLGMGIYMASTAFGAVMGRLLAGWITYLYSWREAFGVFALLLLVALLAMKLRFPTTQNPLESETSVPNKARLKPSFPMNLKIFAILLIPMVVFFSFMAITTFVTYQLAQAPFLLNEAQLGNLFLVLLLAVVVSPLAGKYSDRFGRVKILFLALFSLILGMLLTLDSSLISIIVGMGLVTIGMFSVQSVTPTYLGDLVPENRSTMAVMYQTFFYFGGAMGTILPVLAWKYGGYDGVVMLSLSLVVLGMSPFFVIMVKRRLDEN